MAPPSRRSTEPNGPPLLAPTQIVALWSGGRLPRAVLIAGPETALREEALANLRRAAFGDGDGGLNWVVLYGPASDQEPNPLDAATILDEARTRPLFGGPGEPKVVVVRQASLLLGARRKEDDGDRPARAAGAKKTPPTPREVFEDHLDSIPEGSTLVFEVAQEGALRNTNFFKGLAARHCVVDCSSLRDPWELDGADSRLGGEVRQNAKALGLTLDGRAIAALIARCGQDLGVLREELAKLALALGAGPERNVAVGEAQVEETCASTRLVSPFEFCDLLAVRDLPGALEALHAIFAHGLGDHRRPGRVVTNESEIAMRVVSAVNYKFAQLQDARAVLDLGANEVQAMQAVRVYGRSRQDKFGNELRRFTSVSLRAALAALLRANLALRSSADKREVLEKLAWDLCRA